MKGLGKRTLHIKPGGVELIFHGYGRIDIIEPSEILLTLPTGEEINIDVVLEHLEQEFGPWPRPK